MSILAKQILLLDSVSGIVVGLLLLSLKSWFGEHYGLTEQYILFIGATNLCYGSYSGSLYLRFSRQKKLSLRSVNFLVVANGFWPLPCLAIILYNAQTIKPFGMAHVLLEAFYVVLLAVTEFRVVRPLASTPASRERA